MSIQRRKNLNFPGRYDFTVQYKSGKRYHFKNVEIISIKDGFKLNLSQGGEILVKKNTWKQVEYWKCQ